jgi:prepilin-type N-terminal cleavage/methylation domain-containing protein
MSFSSARERGFTLLEVVIAMAILVTALLGFIWGIGVSVQEVGSTKLSYIAANAARGKIEEMKTQPFDELYAKYGPNTGASTFQVTYQEEGRTLVLEGPKGAKAGRVILCVNEMNIPKEFGWRTSFDLNTNGDALDSNVSPDYTILPVLVRISWVDAYGPRTVEMTTILIDPQYPEEEAAAAALGS